MAKLKINFNSIKSENNAFLLVIFFLHFKFTCLDQLKQSMFRPWVNDIRMLHNAEYDTYFDDRGPLCESKSMEEILTALRSGAFARGLHMYSMQLPPFYSKRDKLWVKDKRRYFIAGWASIARMCLSGDVPLHERSFYEMMCIDYPLHMFFDFDLAIDPSDTERKKTVPLAIVEMIRCISIVFQREHEANPDDPFYAGVDFEKNVTYHITTSNREDKQSSHLIIRLPGNRMFNNFNDIRRIVRAAIEESVNSYPSPEDSPLKIVVVGPNNMKKGKPIERTIKNIIDDSIFNINRNFRFLNCLKACLPSEVGKKKVLVARCKHHPPCHYSLETCSNPENATPLDDYDVFYSNCASYVPLDPETARPVDLLIGRYKREYGDDAGECDKSLLLASTQGKLKTPSTSLPLQLSIRDYSNASTKAKLISELISAVEAQVMSKAKFQRGDGPDGFLFSLETLYCPYVDRNHRHNHSMISVLLGYPRPILFYKCHDEITCKESATGVKQNKIVEPLYDAIWDKFLIVYEEFLLAHQFDCQLELTTNE